ncbi:PapB family radical SAM/SPASM ranthipeptide maturase [Abyssisolibacter fermentans]|uniref:PapB family radical SAM/SPASM ranthipeptide maturase n=1 Tax=Abyssisolibacter fermentans TaxID=1766203 RepID=UPI00082A6F37|nr:SPASM domain-containing protein [Abyssisolibacter fermentans]
MTVVKFNKDINKYYPFAIKFFNDNYYLYNLMTNAIFLMDENSYNILINDDNINREKYIDTVRFFENNFILVTPENESKLDELYNKVVMKKKFLNSTALTLMISQECNLRCKYCYGENGEYSNKGKMDFIVAKKAIDYFIQQSPSDKLSICFFGGEPLLNIELIEEVIEYTREIEKNSNKKFNFSMTTNATLIDKKIEKFIINNKIDLTVSIDGSKEMNDSNRYYANNKGVYNDIKKKTSGLKKFITARATLSPPNLDVMDSITHIVNKFGFKKVAWAEADNLLNDKDYNLLKNSTHNLLDKLENLINCGKYNEVRKYHTFINMLKKFNSDGIRTKGCGAGSNLMAVDIDGKIYPCHRFVGIEEYVLGNVSDEKLEENLNFYSNVDLVNFKKCEFCIAKNICAGGCINENYVANQSINEPSDKHCEYRISIVERLLEIYIKLDDNAKKQLFSNY